MRHLIYILLLFLTLTIKAQNISGLYTSPDLDKFSLLSLNLYGDSAFNYYFWKEGGYAITVIDRCGRYLIRNDTLILKAIIIKDSITIGDTKIMTDKNLKYYDYLNLQSYVYSQKPEICIQIDDSLRNFFPDIRFFINYDFSHEKLINKNNQVLFEYPKTTTLKYINIRSIYFNINIDFDSYYHSIDNDNWRVEKNLLKLTMRNQLTSLKQKEFKIFARYLMKNGSLILIDADIPDYEIMKNNKFTLILNKR